MSRYEWEKGEFVLPAAEWAGFKSSIRNAVNRSNAVKFEGALKLHAALVARLKGMRNPDIWDIAWEEAQKLDAGGGLHGRKRFGDDEIAGIVSAVVDRKYDNPLSRTITTRVRRPQKKAFPQLGNNANAFDGGECSLTFDNASRKAVWEVFENNHACDSARETVLGTALFAALDKVKWTRGSHGRVWGNDEYSRDAGRDDPGAGGSYSKGSYGPEEDRRKAAAARSPSGYGSFRRW